jgi:cell filamentation protein
MAGGFDARHLQSIHHYIFQDVYPWAGNFRTVDIAKDGHLFGLNQHIGSFLHKTFDDLRNERYLRALDQARFAGRAAYYLGEINAIHPFREGNGRAQREFIRQLALRNGYSIDWSRISRQQMIDASRQSFQKDNAGLEKLLRGALNNEPNK